MNTNYAIAPGKRMVTVTYACGCSKSVSVAKHVSAEDVREIQADYREKVCGHCQQKGKR